MTTITGFAINMTRFFVCFIFANKTKFVLNMTAFVLGRTAFVICMTEFVINFDFCCSKSDWNCLKYEWICSEYDWVQRYSKMETKLYMFALTPRHPYAGKTYHFPTPG